MQTYYKLIEEYPNSEKIGTLFYVKNNSHVTKVDYNLSDLPNESLEVREEHLMTKYYEKYFKISRDGYSIYNKDTVYILNSLYNISSIEFDIDRIYPIPSLIFKTETNCEKYREGLFKESLPKTWQECGIEDGWYIADTSEIKHWSAKRHTKKEANINGHSFLTKRQATSQLVFSQLSKIAKRLNDNWLPDWSNELQLKHTLVRVNNSLVKEVTNVRYQPICFKSAYLRNYALETFEELFKQYYEII